MRQSGFTLVEMTVSVAVGLILLSIAIPGYSRLRTINLLAAETNHFVAALQYARSEALKRATRVTACKSSSSMQANPACDSAASWQDGWVIFVDGGSKGLVDGDDSILRVSGPSGVVYVANNFSSSISYLAHGRSEGSNGLPNGTFTLCFGGELRKIILNSTARIRLESGKC